MEGSVTHVEAGKTPLPPSRTWTAIGASVADDGVAGGGGVKGGGGVAGGGGVKLACVSFG